MDRVGRQAKNTATWASEFEWRLARLQGDVMCIAISLAFILLPAFAGAQTAEVGSRIANFTLRDTSGNEYALSQLRGRFAMIVFWAFKCPVSLSYDDRLTDLLQRFGSRGVLVVAVDSNSNEAPEEIRRNVSNLGLSFPVLLDTDGALAGKLGASHAPSVFILDRDGVLRYRGAFDNNKSANASGRIAYAEEALEALLKGQQVPIPETRVFGCPIIKKAPGS